MEKCISVAARHDARREFCRWLICGCLACQWVAPAKYYRPDDQKRRANVAHKPNQRIGVEQQPSKKKLLAVFMESCETVISSSSRPAINQQTSIRTALFSRWQTQHPRRPALRHTTRTRRLSPPATAAPPCPSSLASDLVTQLGANYGLVSLRVRKSLGLIPLPMKLWSR
jgi:hypothetical protein